jgi:hypothetical protein
MSESSDDTLSAEDMQKWLEREVAGVTKATELRLKDATDFVVAYALGKITAEQAMDRLMRYESRWGDSPLPDVPAIDGMTDDQILGRLDSDLPPGLRERLLKIKDSSARGRT